MWQAVAAIASSVAAIAALTVAILNYRSRPLLIRSRERHSDELKEITQQWANSIPKVLSWSRPGYTDHPPSPIKLGLEEELLFKDLENHIPPELDPFKIWGKYKSNYLDYENHVGELSQEIRKHAEAQLELSLNSKVGSGDETGISLNLIDVIRNNLGSLVAGRKQTWLNEELKLVDQRTGIWLVSGAPAMFLVATIGERAAREAHENIQRMLTDLNNQDELRTRASKLNEDQEVLATQRQALLNAIQQLLKIPILPGDCEYLKRAAK